MTIHNPQQIKLIAMGLKGLKQTLLKSITTNITETNPLLLAIQEAQLKEVEKLINSINQVIVREQKRKFSE